MVKAHAMHDPELEAALDEVDAVLTVEIISEILRDLPDFDEADADSTDLIRPAARPGRPSKRKQ